MGRKRQWSRAQPDCLKSSARKRQLSRRSFHALRHSFNSAMANEGVSQEVRMKLTGHKTEAVNRGYTHHELAPLRAAVDKIPSLG
jgi:integrase